MNDAWTWIPALPSPNTPASTPFSVQDDELNTLAQKYDLCLFGEGLQMVLDQKDGKKVRQDSRIESWNNFSGAFESQRDCQSEAAPKGNVLSLSAVTSIFLIS